MEVARPLLARHAWPRALVERLAGSGDGARHVLGAGVRGVTDVLLGRGVEHREAAAAGRLAPAPVDVELVEGQGVARGLGEGHVMPPGAGIVGQGRWCPTGGLTGL